MIKHLFKKDGAELEDHALEMITMHYGFNEKFDREQARSARIQPPTKTDKDERLVVSQGDLEVFFGPKGRFSRTNHVFQCYLRMVYI